MKYLKESDNFPGKIRIKKFKKFCAVLYTMIFGIFSGGWGDRKP